MLSTGLDSFFRCFAHPSDLLTLSPTLHTRFQLVRINLSEQTDVSDLFGSDLPVPDADPAEWSQEEREGGQGGGAGARFAWCDGVFLSALKAGKWVLLDELNLATQVSCGLVTKDAYV